MGDAATSTTTDRVICGDGANDTANSDIKDHTSACETVNAS